MTPDRAQRFDELCPSAMLPLRMSHKWSPLIMRLLGEEPHTFTELRHALPRLGPKELTRALRSLEHDGFVSRGSPPKSAGYALTPLGHRLLEVLVVVYSWTATYWDELVDAQELSLDA